MEEWRLPAVLWRLWVVAGGRRGNSAFPCGVWEGTGGGLCWHLGGFFGGVKVVVRVVMMRWF